MFVNKTDGYKYWHNDRQFERELTENQSLIIFWTGLEEVQLFTVGKPGRELINTSCNIRMSYRCLGIARSIDMLAY